MIKTMYKGTGLTFASGSPVVGVGCKLVHFVVYSVSFVMMSTNNEKHSAVSEEAHVLTAYVFFFLVVRMTSMQIKSFWNPFSKIKLRT